MEVDEGKLGSILTFMEYLSAPMSLCTSILKDIAEQTIPKTLVEAKRLNKPWFSDICKDAIKQQNSEPTEVNLKAYHIARG